MHDLKWSYELVFECIHIPGHPSPNHPPLFDQNSFTILVVHMLANFVTLPTIRETQEVFINNITNW